MKQYQHMYLIRVAPLAALPASVPQALDYFWTAPLLPGALVKAMVGRRAVIAIVLDCMPAERAKLSLKKATFTARKLESVVTELPQATVEQMGMAQWLAEHYAAPLGMCLKTVLPSFIGKPRAFLTVISDEKSRTTKKENHVPRFVLSQPDTAIKEISTILKHPQGQVVIILPETALAHSFAKELKAHAPLLFHSGMPAKPTRDTYRSVLDGSVRLIVGTRSALFLPWKNLTHVIVEDPMHEAYKSDMSPRYGAADVARQLATMHGAALTYLSPAIGAVQHHVARRKGIIIDHQKPYWPKTTLVSMEKEYITGNRSLFSRAAQRALVDAVDTNKPVLLYSPRRAYTGLAACGTCHAPAQCRTCELPMRFHKHGDKADAMLVCYHCAGFSVVPKQCPSCKAGALKPTGLAGSQKIAEAAMHTLIDAGVEMGRIPILDSDLVKTENDAKAIWERFDAMQRPVLVATQMAFTHRYARQFHTIIAPQADALAYNPDFRTQERLIWQLEKLADFKPEIMLLQAIRDTDTVLAAAPGRAWDTVLDQELKDRKALDWPPFCRIAKFTYTHTDRSTGTRQAAAAADKLMRAITHEKLKHTQVFGPTPALTQRAGGRWAWHLILKMGADTTAAARLLPYLGAGWTADIDPRSIT